MRVALWCAIAKVGNGARTTMTKQKNELTAGDLERPLAVSIARASELSGFGPTSIWAFLRDGRLTPVRVPGVRRTLVSYASLSRLLAPPSEEPPRRRRGRPRKTAPEACT
jgi:hypothetical protein